MPAGHSPALAVLTLTNLLTFILYFVLNVVYGRPEWFPDGTSTFSGPVGNVSNLYYTDFTPTSQIYGIWAAIFVWQGGWMLYTVTSIFRRTPVEADRDLGLPDTDPGRPVYTNPILLSSVFYLCCILNWLLLISWSFLWILLYFWVDTLVATLTLATSGTCLVLAHRSMSRHFQTLTRDGRKTEIWFFRVLVENGLAAYTSWLAMEVLINLACSLSYDIGPFYDHLTSGTISFTILTVFMLVFALTDWTVLDRFSRYTLTPYIVVIVTLSGILARIWAPGKSNAIFAAVLLTCSLISFIIKLGLLTWRCLKDRLREYETAQYSRFNIPE